MKKNRIPVWIFFVVSLAIFIGYNYTYYRNLDTIGPVIRMDDERVAVSVEDGEDVMLRGVTANDTHDGDVSAFLGVEKIFPFDGEATRRIQIVAFDSDNHVSRASRQIVYTDYEHPRFRLMRPLRFAVANNNNVTENIIRSVQVQDCLDGNISDGLTLRAEDPIPVNTSGDYPVVLEVTNSAGDHQELPATVTLYYQAEENLAPQFELTDYLIYIEQGETPDPLAYVKQVIYKGDEYSLTDQEGTFRVNTDRMTAEEREEFSRRKPSVRRSLIRVENDVDPDTPGTYEIRYSLYDAAGNEGSVRLIVIVEESK